MLHFPVCGQSPRYTHRLAVWNEVPVLIGYVLLCTMVCLATGSHGMTAVYSSLFADRLPASIDSKPRSVSRRMYQLFASTCFSHAVPRDGLDIVRLLQVSNQFHVVAHHKFQECDLPSSVLQVEIYKCSIFSSSTRISVDTSAVVQDDPIYHLYIIYIYQTSE